jgi:hypothetical protein
MAEGGVSGVEPWGSVSRGLVNICKYRNAVNCPSLCDVSEPSRNQDLSFTPS